MASCARRHSAALRRDSSRSASYRAFSSSWRRRANASSSSAAPFEGDARGEPVAPPPSAKDAAWSDLAPETSTLSFSESDDPASTRGGGEGAARWGVGEPDSNPRVEFFVESAEAFAASSGDSAGDLALGPAPSSLGLARLTPRAGAGEATVVWWCRLRLERRARSSSVSSLGFGGGRRGGWDVSLGSSRAAARAGRRRGRRAADARRATRSTPRLSRASRVSVEKISGTREGREARGCGGAHHSMASVVAARDEKEKERRDASVGLRARPRASSVLPRPPRPSRALKSSFFKIKSRLWLAGKQDVGISRQISQLAPLCGPVRIYKPSQQMENG